MEGKRILVIGGGGSIGTELVRQVCPKNSVFVLDTNETGFFDIVEEQRLAGNEVDGRVGDIRNRQTIDDVFFQVRPDMVFMLAALKHVSPSEKTPREAIEINLVGLCNVVDAAKKYSVERFVFTSSDKAVTRDNVYGLSKRMGELIVRNAGYVSVRFTNCLGSRGSIIPLWEKAVKENRPINVTDERMERYFLPIEQACSMILRAAELGKPGDIMVLGEKQDRINILELAKKIISASGKDIPIRMIGIRPGEQLKEELMTIDELQKAKKVDEFLVIEV
jgi:FlaA1/EpsC-like NDP-sugar epimerase